ncbi:hypothetical protein N431DRAFT_415994 [Stipitochalara longipes BDJ]|nr:hypothetical protein N431DRAFT_415994 [Stipitochalara longipes BDJ]
MRQPPRTSFLGARAAILFATIISVIPFLLMPSVLLHIIFQNQVRNTDCPVPELCLAGNRQIRGSYLVNFPAPKLIFIASWASTISNSLIGILMLLTSYPIAHGILIRSSIEKAALPNPYQLSLIIRCLNGQLKSIWDFLIYKFTCRKRCVRIARPLQAALLMLLLAILLGLFIQLNDTWLHLVTESISVPQIYPTNMTEWPGQGLAPWCIANLNNTDISDESPISCAMNNVWLFYNLSSVYGVLSSRSKSQTVYNINKDSVTHALLGPPGLDSAVDYIAPTYSVTTECTAIADRCNLTNDTSGVDLVFEFTDDWTQSVDTFDGSSVRWSLAAAVDSVEIDARNPSSNQLEGGGMWNDLTTSGWTVIAACTTTSKATHPPSNTNKGIAQTFLVYDATYTYVNGTMSIVDVRNSNDTLVRILNDVFTHANRSSLTPMLQNAWKLSNTDEKQRDQTYLDRFAPLVSQISAGFLAGQLSPRPEVISQRRVWSIVALVPKTPLWMLVSSCLVYAAVAFILSVLAIIYSTSDIRQVQLRLSIPGLVSELFDEVHAGFPAESDEHLFGINDNPRGGSDLRIGLSKAAAGGFKYNIW